MPVEVTTDDGQQISAGFISFSPGVIPAARGMVQQPSAIASLASFLPMQVYLPDVSSVSDTQMTKLTLQEQMLKAGRSAAKMAKVQRTAKNPAFRPVRPGKRWKKIKSPAGA